MKTYSYLLPALACAVVLLGSAPGLAQGSQNDAVLEIAYVEANTTAKSIDLYVKAYDASGQPLLTTDRSGLSAFMRQGRRTSDSLTILEVSPYQSDDSASDGRTSSKQASVHALFLLDLSGSMRGDKLDKAKQAIRTVLERDMLKGSNSTVEFAWFHDDISGNKKVSKYNFQAVVDPVDVGPEGQGKDTDLYRAIRDKTSALSQSPAEQKVLILLTDGNNDIERNQNYRGSNRLQPISRSEILSHVSKLDSSLQIFSIGIGSDADEPFLRDLTNNTVNPNDSYSYNVAPSELARKLVQVAGKIGGPNCKISLFPDPEDAVFGPEERTFTLNYENPSDKKLHIAQKIAVLGSATHSVDLRPGVSRQDKNYILALVTGIVLLGLLLAILSLLAPIYNEKQFKAKHVKKYRDVKRAGVSNKIESFTQEPFQDDEDVVVNTKGDKMLKLTTWKYLRSENQEYATGDYAELFTLEAKSGDFFSQRGIFKKLNWLWFGALGGVLAWGLNALLGMMDWEWYKEMLTVFDDAAKQISPSIFRETLTGIAIGAGVVGALAVAEERGSFRGFNMGSVLLRILIGIAAGYIFFFIESVLIAKYIPYDFWGHLVAWTLFGTAMGVVVTLLSSIELINGLKGGVLAGLAAFLLYYLLNLPVMNEIFPGEVARVISFFCYGGLLGIILFTVIESLEAYELLCLSPKTFAGWQSPISKWLKSPGIDFISMGTNPKNRVYIKWEDDEVRPRHARLRLIREIPYIEPDEGPVWVNRTPINSATPLNDGDSIQLSNYSILQFVAKEQKASTASPGGRSAIKVKRRSPKEVQAVRSKIKINRKP